MTMHSLVLLVFFESFFCVATLPMLNCLGGRKHGSRVDLQQFWYYCNNGLLENRGCFAQHQKRVVIGERLISEGVATLCYHDEQRDELKLKYIGCNVEGRMYSANEFWNDRANRRWYFCEQLGSEMLKLRLGGCVVDGERIAEDAQVVRQGVVYECRTSEGLLPIGCMHSTQRINLGNTFQTSSHWYLCRLSGDGKKGLKIRMGCVHNGQKLQNGAQYKVDQLLYQCTLGSEATSHQLLGCIIPSNDQNEFGFNPVGARWIAGFAPYKYKVQCRLNDTVGTAGLETIACVHVDTSGKHRTLHVNCVRIIDDKAVACRRDHKGILIFVIFDKKFINLATDMGLTVCS